MKLKNMNKVLNDLGRVCLCSTCDAEPVDDRLYCSKHMNKGSKPEKSKALCNGCKHKGKDCWEYENAKIIKRRIHHYKYPFIYQVMWAFDCWYSSNKKEIDKL